jgi:hypothetical protein
MPISFENTYPTMGQTFQYAVPPDIEWICVCFAVAPSYGPERLSMKRRETEGIDK